MRLKFRIETETPAHITTRVFVNGASAGLLTVTLDEYDRLTTALLNQAKKPTSELLVDADAISSEVEIVHIDEGGPDV